MSDVFKSRSLNVIEDFSIDERRYFFRKTKELKDAILSSDDEVMDKLRVAQTTFYGEAGAPVLNLYADRSTTLSYNSGDYFLQCIYGNTNEENGDNHLIFSQEKTFEWVFYVTHSGIVYAKLVIDAEGEVLIKNGFTCEASAMLEIK